MDGSTHNIHRSYTCAITIFRKGTANDSIFFGWELILYQMVVLISHVGTRVRRAVRQIIGTITSTEQFKYLKRTIDSDICCRC